MSFDIEGGQGQGVFGPISSGTDASRLHETRTDTVSNLDASLSEIPQQIGPYRIIRMLGQGGMGLVFLAEDSRLQRRVALKVFKGNLASGSDARRFQAESKAAAKLSHPNFVQIYEAGEERGIRYLAMVYVEGQTLADRVATNPLPSLQAALLIRQIADAMGYAHQQGVIHRDLKPANIIVDFKGQPSIMDFGLATRSDVDSSLTQAGLVMGTPSYMSPEQTHGNNELVGKQSDIYALGATLYCLVTGRPPFVGSNVVETLRYIIEREPVPPRELNPAVPRDLETICLKCLDTGAIWPLRPAPCSCSMSARPADIWTTLRRNIVDGSGAITRPNSTMPSWSSMESRENPPSRCSHLTDPGSQRLARIKPFASLGFPTSESHGARVRWNP